MRDRADRCRRIGPSGLCLPVLALVGGCAHPPPMAASPTPGPPGAADAPVVDVALGERAWPDEQALGESIGAAIEQSIRRRYRPGEARRDAHPKAHGCVTARFEVDPRLPPELAKGLFVPGASYLWKFYRLFIWL